MDWQLICQGFSLLYFFVWSTLAVVVSFPVVFVKNLTVRKKTKDIRTNQVVFYEGVVSHIRRKPVENKFEYEVRMALINLDDPPKWFVEQGKEHYSADEARSLVGTDGLVKLFTHPSCLGYIQNPISVYYCYTQDKKLQSCIAEVTNTPWGERVVFAFDPTGHRVPKCLHVSPFMDMQSEWILKTSDPGEILSLSVLVDHHKMGRFFDATLLAKLSQSTSRNDDDGIVTWLRYGYQPFRVAFWIYWQAIILVSKGVDFYNPPSKQYQETLEVKAKANSLKHQPVRTSKGCYFNWRELTKYPWNA